MNYRLFLDAALGGRGLVPLLTELACRAVGPRSYEQGAPNGATPPVPLAGCEAFGGPQ